ncbi:MAG: alpha-N-arabinofuranosidase [Lachnospiraceae bacterium]|nr:alpha-N-arabinofuranosidase [Lachnospiraceae bacterium]
MAKMYINPNVELSKINREIQGHFSEHLGRCIYEGLYVGENSDIPNVNGMRKDVVEALKEMKIPVLRWPGGCFADEYHWKDGIGPKEKRKKMINTHWGGVLEDNSFGTHEFMELCRQLGCETYINGNVGSGTVQEMNEWVEYMTLDGVSPMADMRKANGRQEPWKVDFFGVGNENWGCGGNMTPEYYANEYRRYQTYVRNYGGPRIYKIACGANAADYNWTETVMKIAGRYMDGISLHYYTVPHGWSGSKGPATGFDEKEYYLTLKCMTFTDELLRKHEAIMDKYDPEKRVGLIFDEWGTWYDVEPGTNPGFLYQQNTMRDAIVAATTLNIFNKHSDRIRMANIAQLVNVLQSVILTEGAKMVKTPTYYVFKMYADHQDARLVQSSVEKTKIGTEENKVDDLYESVSKAEDGSLTVTVANLSATESRKIEAVITDYDFKSAEGSVISADMGAYNTFDKQNEVVIRDFSDFRKTADGLEFNMPACSVVKLRLKK